MRLPSFHPAPALLLAAALALSGCAADPAKPDVDWSHGARHGWVAAFYDGATPRAQLPACLAQLPAEALAQHRYVRIDYRHVRRMLTEVAELPDGAAPRLGDRVELWPADCDSGKLSRISRVMPPPA